MQRATEHSCETCLNYYGVEIERSPGYAIDVEHYVLPVTVLDDEEDAVTGAY